jgi:hypothetical protein
LVPEDVACRIAAGLRQADADIRAGKPPPAP